MPVKGYRHISVREEIYRRLEEFAKSKGLAYPVDAIALLLEYADIYSKLECMINQISGGINTRLPQNKVEEEKIEQKLPQSRIEEEIDKEIEKVFKTIDTEKLVQKPITEIPRVFCVKKRDIKDLDKYIKFLKEDGVYITHWDEYDKYCFKVRDIYKE
jgi:hypothetical protein